MWFFFTPKYNLCFQSEGSGEDCEDQWQPHTHQHPDQEDVQGMVSVRSL